MVMIQRDLTIMLHYNPVIMITSSPWAPLAGSSAHIPALLGNPWWGAGGKGQMGGTTRSESCPVKLGKDGRTKTWAQILNFDDGGRTRETAFTRTWVSIARVHHHHHPCA